MMSLSLLLSVELTDQGVFAQTSWEFSVLCAMLVAAVLSTTMGEAGPAKKIKASRPCDPEGMAQVFLLTFGTETTTLDPGKPWSKVDLFKWVTRGLIEEPLSFHVLGDGSVEVNGEKISLQDPEGAAKLEDEINKRHATPIPRRTPPIARATRAAAGAGRPDRVAFKVRLDHLGHLLVEGFRRAERMETGIRGLPLLIQNGFMLKPKSVHVDPLLRGVEIDGVRFESSEAGAQQLQEVLNAQYAPLLGKEEEAPVEIKENPAAATGFDIRFVTIRAGAKFEIKGHLSQDKLDILQDSAKCDLLQQGIVLRLSPPHLLLRRRRPDSSEEKIPELPDVLYRRVNAQQLQQVLNHPLIRRNAGEAARPTGDSASEQAADIVEMRVVRNPLNKLFLWLECATAQGGKPEGRALTHHNIAELQHSGVFLPHLDVSLSLDNRVLSFLNKQTQQEESVAIEWQSSDAELCKASVMLTASLKPPSLPAVEHHPKTPSPPEATQPDTSSKEENPPTETHPPTPTSNVPLEPESMPATETAAPGLKEHSAAAEQLPAPPPSRPMEEAKVPAQTLLPDALEEPQATPAPEPYAELFVEADPLHLHTEIFRNLAQRIGAAVQDVRLSLPRIFENRRFEIISLSHPEVSSVLELRSEEFVGFYLTHINERKILLAYACNGKRIEWGSDKCLLQPDVTTDPDEFKGHALLGMALDRDCRYVFVIKPPFREWVKRREKLYLEASILFVTVQEFAAAPDGYSLVWPRKDAG